MTASFLISSCQKDSHDIGNLTAPSNLQVNYSLAGADDTHPNGDGSGMANFTADADNALSYTFDFGDGKDKVIAPGGTVTHQFSLNGLVKYNVLVVAIGTGGIITTQPVPVEVFSSFSDEEATQFLTGGSSKSWYWAADQQGHLGLGPNDQQYENGDHTWPAWYQAQPWEKSGSSLYDCELKFNFNDDGTMSFEQINPTGEAFIQGIYAEELGLGDEGSHPFDIEGVKSATFGPSNSIATVDGGYRGTTINISDGGFMGFYAGSSEYEIIEISESLLKVRMVQTNNPLFAWYHIFTNVKPVQPSK